MFKTSPDRGFGHVETWVFDLDNTLYPHHLNLWQQVDARIRDYIASFLGLNGEEAFRKQKDFYRRYGTTMRGMMAEHGMSPTISSTMCTGSTTRPSSPIRRSARRSKSCLAASSSSPTVPGRMRTPS